MKEKGEAEAATGGMEEAHAAQRRQSRRRRFPLLCLTSIGVVYGDIGTSPLYAFRECFHPGEGGNVLPPNMPNVLGILSLVAWSLLLVITVKYLLYVMRADNKGEGGILALLALMQRHGGRSFWFGTLSVFGAALLFGDGMITPAISVLSAVEGLKLAAPGYEHYLLPITVGILVGLFLLQCRGTKAIGLLFGPIMMLWFFSIGLLGLRAIMAEPSVLKAFDPSYGFHFFQLNGWMGFTILGAVVLVVTGGEALYADLGHFGALPIRAAWFVLVLPALLLNYFGQGASLITNPKVADNPFFHLAPNSLLYGMVALATCATIIASQAIISGVFSLTRQAILLDEFPRVEIVQTSEDEAGQVYAPALNWMLMVATIGLVLGFRTSSRLAAAYGVAVTATMLITTILVAKIAYQIWKWNLWIVIAITVPLLGIDLAFFGANILKFVEGGWFPLLVGGVVFFVMTTWSQGRELLLRRRKRMEKPLPNFLKSVALKPPIRVPGLSIFLTGRKQGAPAVLLHHLKHNKVLSDKVIILNIVTEDIPHISCEDRCSLEQHSQGVCHIIMKFGYMDVPNVPKTLKEFRTDHQEFDLDEVTYYIGRQTPIPKAKYGHMSRWRERFFAFMLRNATHPVDFLRIPPQQVVELGLEIEI